MKIIAHTLVKNEERLIWFSVMSIINHVDKILLWDTGSSDNTVYIIKNILKDKNLRKKIDFKEVGEVNTVQFTNVRQKMLDQTNSDWFLIVDGDEVWWNNSIKNLIDTIKKEDDRLDFITSPFYNIVGDIYHYQEEEAGMYHIGEKKGHINIRAVNRKIPGLHFAKPHGTQGLFDDKDVLIQDRSPAHFTTKTPKPPALVIMHAFFPNFPYLEKISLKENISFKLSASIIPACLKAPE